MMLRSRKLGAARLLETAGRGVDTVAMPLFEVDKESQSVAEIPPTTFPALRLWERQDLEAWVTSAPELAGGDFTVVTSEYDRFDRTTERLDVLGVVRIEEGHGRLVVIELKRGGTSTTVDLQAIKYAAYVAACKFSDVVEMYATYHDVAADDARERLLELLGGTQDEPPLIDNTPRIVLVAADFRPEVTTTGYGWSTTSRIWTSAASVYSRSRSARRSRSRVTSSSRCRRPSSIALACNESAANSSASNSKQHARAG
jgi:hypothetical protein